MRNSNNDYHDISLSAIPFLLLLVKPKFWKKTIPGLENNYSRRSISSFLHIAENLLDKSIIIRQEILIKLIRGHSRALSQKRVKIWRN